jgi:general stress protein YciG
VKKDGRSFGSNVKVPREENEVSGSKIGGKAARDTNYKRYGLDFYREIGAIGGKNGRTGGFYVNRDLASIAGAIGGRISRRGRNKLTEKQRREIYRAYKELLAVHNKAMARRTDEGAITVFDRKRGLVVSEVA